MARIAARVILCDSRGGQGLPADDAVAEAQPPGARKPAQAAQIP
jgi:hypothetical protein